MGSKSSMFLMTWHSTSGLRSFVSSKMGVRLACWAAPRSAKTLSPT